MEPRSRANDDHAQYHYQYRNGPEARPRLVHERMLAPSTWLVLGAVAVTRTDHSSPPALEAHLSSDGVRLESWSWLATAHDPGVGERRPSCRSNSG